MITVDDAPTYVSIDTLFYRLRVFRSGQVYDARLYRTGTVTSLGILYLLIKSGGVTYTIYNDPAKTITVETDNCSSNAIYISEAYPSRVIVTIRGKFYNATSGYLNNDIAEFKFIVYEDRIITLFDYTPAADVLVDQSLPYPFKWGLAGSGQISVSGTEQTTATAVSASDYMTIFSPVEDASASVNLFSSLASSGLETGNMVYKYATSTTYSYIGWSASAAGATLKAGSTYRACFCHTIDINDQPGGVTLYTTAALRLAKSQNVKNTSATLSTGTATLTVTGYLPLGSDGLFTDGAWHFDTVSDECSLSWDIDRVYEAVVFNGLSGRNKPLIYIDGTKKIQFINSTLSYDYVTDGVLTVFNSILADSVMAVRKPNALLVGSDAPVPGRTNREVSNLLINSRFIDSDDDGLPDFWDVDFNEADSYIKNNQLFLFSEGEIRQVYSQELDLQAGRTYLFSVYLHYVFPYLAASAIARISGVTATIGQTYIKAEAGSVGWYGFTFTADTVASPRFQLGIGIDGAEYAGIVFEAPTLADVTDSEYQYPFNPDYSPTAEESATRYFQTIKGTPSPAYMSCWGDSLTAGNGLLSSERDHLIWGHILAKSTGYPMYLNGGYGGAISTYIKDQMLLRPDRFGDVTIIWVGRNNKTDPVTIKADIATMVSVVTSGKYLIISVTNGDYLGERLNDDPHVVYDTIIQLNQDLATLYGDAFVDIRSYMAGLGAPGEDYEDAVNYAKDIPPAVLLAGEIHYSLLGNQVIADYLETIFQAKGWAVNTTGYCPADLQYPGPFGIDGPFDGTAFPTGNFQAPLGRDFQLIPEFTDNASVDLATLAPTAKIRIGPRGMIVRPVESDAATIARDDRVVGA